ncbi:MAG: hypothetical protein VX777_07940 [Chlamydiota bacterium]|nr:hypothetical protein [Chlamydiota bacterium]
MVNSSSFETGPRPYKSGTEGTEGHSLKRSRACQDSVLEPPKKCARTSFDRGVVERTKKILENTIESEICDLQQFIRNEISKKITELSSNYGSKAAVELFRKIYFGSDSLNISITPDRASYSAIIQACFRDRNNEGVLSCYNEMKRKGVKFDSKAMNFIIRSFIAENKGLESKIVRFYRENFKQKESWVSLKNFNNLMNIYLKAGEIDEALIMYKSAVREGRKMDRVSLSIVMSAYANLEAYQSAIDIFFKKEELGFEGEVDKYLISKLLILYCQVGTPLRAIETYENLEKLGFSKVDLDGYVLNSLMRACIEGKRPDLAISYFEKSKSYNKFCELMLVEAFLEESSVEKAKDFFKKMGHMGEVCEQNSLPLIDSHDKPHGVAVVEILCYLDTLDPKDNVRFQVVTGKGLHSKGDAELFQMKNYIINYFANSKNDLKGNVVVNCDDNNSGTLWFTYGPKKVQGVGEVLNEEDYRMIPLWMGYTEKERGRIANYLCDPKNEQVVVRYLAEFLHWAHDKNNKLANLRANKQDIFTHLLNKKIPVELQGSCKLYMYDKSQFIEIQAEPRKNSEGRIYLRKREGEGMKYDILLPLSLVNKGEAHYQSNKII